MFNYVFPIFCFGLVITGIVFLGIRQAAEQLKAESAQNVGSLTRDNELNLAASSDSNPPRSAVRNSHE